MRSARTRIIWAGLAVFVALLVAAVETGAPARLWTALVDASMAVQRGFHRDMIAALRTVDAEGAEL